MVHAILDCISGEDPMTTGAEKLWNQVHGRTPPRRIDIPITVLPSARPLDPVNNPALSLSPSQLNPWNHGQPLIDIVASAPIEPPKQEEPKMQKFWKLAGEGYDIPQNFTSKEDDVAHGKTHRAMSLDNKPLFVLESVKVLCRPLPNVEEIDL